MTTVPLPRVLVVGASGALGRPVVRMLRARSVPVRALCRHPERAADLAAVGAEVVAGDLTDAASLARACAGCQRVLAAAHGLLGRGRWRSEAVDDTGHRQLIAAAREAGLDRFVYTSAQGAAADHPIDFFRTKHRIEQALQASGLASVVLRPTAFMEQHVHLFNGAGVLKNGSAKVIGSGRKRRNFVAAGDVAQFAVRALLDEPLPFRLLVIGGHDNASHLDVAGLYAGLVGKPLRVSRLPAGVVSLLARLLRPVQPGVARLMGLLALPDDAFDEEWGGAAALEREHGVTLTRLSDFVQARVAEARMLPP